MKSKALMGTLIAAGAVLGFSAPAMAERAVVATGPGGYVVQYGPPAPITEVIPAPRSGYVWNPGHYVWRNGQYDWVAGHWVNDRPGYEWREARWERRPDGSWILVEGAWVRDRYAYNDDDDDRYSRGPNGDMDGDGIRNRDDRDRDGDGVANRNDDYPGNPNRS